MPKLCLIAGWLQFSKSENRQSVNQDQPSEADGLTHIVAINDANSRKGGDRNVLLVGVTSASCKQPLLATPVQAWTHRIVC